MEKKVDDSELRGAYLRADCCKIDEKIASLMHDGSKEFFSSISAFLLRPHLELEARLTHIKTREVTARRLERNYRDQPNRKSVVPGVTKEDFTVLMSYIKGDSKTNCVCSTSPKEVLKILKPECTHTEDVKMKDRRYTFVINSDGSSSFHHSEKKKRLKVLDIPLPEEISPYHIRIALSEELEIIKGNTDNEKESTEKTVSSSGEATPTTKPHLKDLQGYRRRKKRSSFRVDSFQYDLTEVTSEKDREYEVEIEWISPPIDINVESKTNEVLDKPDKEGSKSPAFTEMDVCSILLRAAELATVKGLGGMPSEDS